MKHRLAVRPHEDEIRIGGLAIGQLPPPTSATHRLTRHPEAETRLRKPGPGPPRVAVHSARLERDPRHPGSGPPGLPVVGPSSQSSPSQRKPFRMTSTASCEFRARSVSSMRTMNAHPCAARGTQLKSAVRAPQCGGNRWMGNQRAHSCVQWGAEPNDAITRHHTGLPVALASATRCGGLRVES